MVIAYRVHPLTYSIGLRMINVDHIGMVNLLAGQRIAPEFIQHLPVQAMADALTPLLELDSVERARMVEELSSVRERLGPPGAPRRVAELARELLDGDV